MKFIFGGLSVFFLILSISGFIQPLTGGISFISEAIKVAGIGLALAIGFGLLAFQKES